MWELNYKESWTLKNWCFWTVVLEKTLESHLDSKEIKPVHPKGDQPWIFIGKIDAEAEATYLATWSKELTHLKRPWCWDRLMAGWEGSDRGWDGWAASSTQWTWQTLRDNERQGSLACCNPWSCKELNTTWRLNNNHRIRERNNEGIIRRNVHSSFLFGFYSFSARALLYFVLKLYHFCCYHASPLTRMRCIESHVDSERESVLKLILMKFEGIKSLWGVVLCIYS